MTAGLFLIPAAVGAGSHVRARRLVSSAVPQWRAYAQQTGLTFEEGSDGISLRATPGQIRAQLVVVGGLYTTRYKRWETRVELAAPPSWPTVLELYGTRGIREILGFRRRLSVAPELDNVVLVRDGGEGAAEAARRLLSDPSARARIGACFADEPGLYVNQEHISVRSRGILDPKLAHDALLSAQRLRTELSGL